MAIGNTIAYSVPVVGTTIQSFSRASDADFRLAYTSAGGSYPATLQLRRSNPLNARKACGLTVRVGPSIADDPGVLTKGSATVSININASQGSVMTAAEIAEFVRYSLSTALAPTLIESLLSGDTA